MKRFSSVTLLVAGLLAGGVVWAAGGASQRVIHMLDYMAVDYPEAVQGGEIINAEEYAEMQDFAAGVSTLLAELPAGTARNGLQERATVLATAVAERVEPAVIAQQAAALRGKLVAAYDVTVAPAVAPDLARGEQLYREHCVSCHGVDARGDGPAGRGLEPPPSDFLDPARQYQQTLYGYYNTITLGVDGTGMRAYTEFGAADRWALAFWLGQVALQGAATDIAPQQAAAGASAIGVDSLGDLTMMAPQAVRSAHGAQGLAVLAALRAEPSLLKTEQRSPLQFARDTLAESRDSYLAGDGRAAYDQAVSAYLDGFEMLEQALSQVDSDLMLAIEAQMTDYRNLLRAEAPAEAVTVAEADLQALLAEAGDRLDSTSLGPRLSFLASFGILLREGLEALLVVAAIAAFLRRAGRHEGMRYLHAGWVGALFAGALTWVLATTVLHISGAARELSEGVVALFAAAILLYVGFWMHDKAQARRWQQYIEQRLSSSLGQGTLWGIALLAFIAVYREAFETVLFYQALWLQTTPAGQPMVFAGFGAAVAVLAVLGWAILKYSVRLPFGLFFGVSAALMYSLAVIFAGKGVMALQEAGYIPIRPVDFPRIDLIGVYPNLQSLGLQAVLVMIALIHLWRVQVRRPSAEAAGST